MNTDDMTFYSTNNPTHTATFREALMRGPAPDGGLYMPERIPALPDAFWKEIRSWSLAELTSELFAHWQLDGMSRETLRPLMESALPFDAPLTRLDDRTWLLELYHGPTLAFKDFGVRTMARMMGHFRAPDDETLHIVTATSGDTGAAVASGFHRVEGIRTWILYPSGKVSPRQEKQFTTLGGNVHAVEVEGTFDDCQRLAKAVFADEELRSHMQLTSANSINIGRLLPQVAYYLRAFAQWPDPEVPPVLSVPSGNFGNLTAGLIAQRSGMPVRRLVAAINRNRTFADYLDTGTWQPRPSVRTISNAMDVGDPNNVARIRALLGEHNQIAEHVSSASFTDEETRDAIVHVYRQCGRILDPHTAVGWRGLQHHRERDAVDHPGIVLATAHPAKFPEVMPEEVRDRIEMPEALRDIMDRPSQSTCVAPDLDRLREVLLAEA